MIFITVGTHEQGFNRLIKEVDRLIENNIIEEEVFAQIGYSSYKPKHFDCNDLISFEEMNSKAKKADIIITHGGPGSIFLALENNKIPVVVPRRAEFSEHVNNHQVDFTKRLSDLNRVIGVFDIEELESILVNYDKISKKCINSDRNTLENVISKLTDFCSDIL